MPSLEKLELRFGKFSEREGLLEERLEATRADIGNDSGEGLLGGTGDAVHLQVFRSRRSMGWTGRVGLPRRSARPRRSSVSFPHSEFRAGAPADQYAKQRKTLSSGCSLSRGLGLSRRCSETSRWPNRRTNPQARASLSGSMAPDALRDGGGSHGLALRKCIQYSKYRYTEEGWIQRAAIVR